MSKHLCRHIYDLGLFDTEGVSLWVLSYLRGARSNPLLFVKKGFETSISIDTLDMVENSKAFDADLFWMLVDTLDINAEAALRACLS